MVRREDQGRMVVAYELLDGDDEEEVTFPARWEVCPRCGGRGTHDHPAFAGGFTGAEWAEMADGDPDWPEDYARGVYSVPCGECGGRTTVLEVDRERCAPEALRRLDEALASEAHYRAEEAYCRRMGF